MTSWEISGYSVIELPTKAMFTSQLVALLLFIHVVVFVHKPITLDAGAIISLDRTFLEE